MVSLPKEAVNISVKTGEEAQQALNEVGEYDKVVENMDRSGFLTGQVTGDVSLEIKKSKGFLTRFFDWIGSFAITGNVISEEDLTSKVTETTTEKILNVSGVSSESGEVVVEYYTEPAETTEQKKRRG